MRTLGIELEYTHKNYARPEMDRLIRELAKAQGMKAYTNFSYQKGVQRNHDFHLTYDASVTSPTAMCRGGYELISRPFHVEDDKFRRGLKNILMNLYKSGAYTDETCGLHVHVFAGDFQQYQIKNVALFYIIWQSVIHSLLPSSRTNDLHRSGHINTALLDTVKKADPYHGPEVSNMAYRMAVSISSLFRSRYLILNMSCFGSNLTYEIRAGQGMLHPRRVWNWIVLTDATAKYIRRTRSLMDDKVRPPDVKQIGEMLELLGVPELTKYYESEYHNWRE